MEFFNNNVRIPDEPQNQVPDYGPTTRDNISFDDYIQENDNFTATGGKHNLVNRNISVKFKSDTRSRSSDDVENSSPLPQEGYHSNKKLSKADILIFKHLSSKASSTANDWALRNSQHPGGNLFDASTAKLTSEETKTNMSRGYKQKLFSTLFNMVFIGFAVFSFVIAIHSSFLILRDEMFLEFLMREGTHNCIADEMDTVTLTTFYQFGAFFHAFASASLLFVTTEETAPICFLWICSQVVKLGQYVFKVVYISRFAKTYTLEPETVEEIILFIILDIFGLAIVVIRYYQLTNSLKDRERKMYGGGSNKVLNHDIVFAQLPSFVQDKSSYRQAANFQIMTILKDLRGDTMNATIPTKSMIAKQVNYGLRALEAVERFSAAERLRELTKRHETVVTKETHHPGRNQKNAT